MRSYFEKMQDLGNELTENQIKETKENIKQIKDVEEQIKTAIDGGVLGLNLLHIILESNKLIVVDVIRNENPPGTLYRIDNESADEGVTIMDEPL